jgi:soluble lytic murein transglycosylase
MAHLIFGIGLLCKVCIPTDSSAGMDPFKEVPIDQVADSKEREIGETLLELSRVRKFTPKDVAKAKKLYKKMMTKNKSFSHYRYILFKLVNILKSDLTIQKYSFLCQLNKKNFTPYITPLQKRFLRQINSQCIKKILSFYTKNPSLSHFLTKSESLKYIIEKTFSSHSHSQLLKFLVANRKNAPLNEALVDIFLSIPEVINKNLNIKNVKPFIRNKRISKAVREHFKDILEHENETLKSIRKINQLYSKAKKNTRNAQLEKILEGLHKSYERYSFNKLYLWKRLTIMAKNIENKSPEASLKIYSFLYSNIKNYNLDESIFNILWVQIQHNKIDDALKFVENENLINKVNTPKILFWAGKLFKLKNNKQESERYFNVLSKRYPLSFYSILAQHLDSSGSLPPLALTTKTKRRPSNIKQTREIKRTLHRIAVWSILNEPELLNEEVNNIISHYLKGQGPDNVKSLVKNLAKNLSGNDIHLALFRIVQYSLKHKLIDLDKNILDMLFPVKYKSLISERPLGDLSPTIVLSLIRQESAFNPKAKSIVGAQGLMQLMPNTAKQFKRRVSYKELYQPETNIRIGLKFLSKLIKKYDGNLIHTLAAYNAGEGRIRKWKRELFKSKIPIYQIESIPYKETRKYVKLILRNIYFYNLLQNKKSEYLFSGLVTYDTKL